jgi:hypothetical protein
MPERAKLSTWKADPEATMRQLFERLPNGPELARAERVSPMMGVLEYPNLIRKVFRPGLALIGDAALSIDPLWGVGCGWAFQSAEWLADAVARTWSNPDALDRGLAAYGRRHRRELAGHEFLISDFSTGRPYNPLERFDVLCGGAGPDLCRSSCCVWKPLHRGERFYASIGSDTGHVSQCAACSRCKRKRLATARCKASGPRPPRCRHTRRADANAAQAFVPSAISLGDWPQPVRHCTREPPTGDEKKCIVVLCIPAQMQKRAPKLFNLSELED